MSTSNLFPASPLLIPRAAPWMKIVLVAAGIYNLFWGLVVIAWPTALFELAGMEPPRYVSIWQCVGMIVGVYGIGYLVAARDPLRHWPIVLVGLLGKIFGPIGFLGAAGRGELPWSFGWTILTNDLIWWGPFAAMLWRAASHHLARYGVDDRLVVASLALDRAIEDVPTTEGSTLGELSRRRPQLVVFLRHAGCTFCRETLSDVAHAREGLDAGIVLVHMGDDDAKARRFFASYGLDDVPRISDPRRQLYAAFGLRRGTIGQLLGPRVWWRGLLAFLGGHGVGRPVGDGFQMPGMFLLRNGLVVGSFRHRRVSDRPDYRAMACDVPGAPEGLNRAPESLTPSVP